MNNKILERFLDHRSSPEENEKVFEWFRTPEGEKYLGELLDCDIDQILRDRKYLLDSGPEQSDLKPDSDKMLSGIRRRIKQKDNYQASIRKDAILPFMKVAAVMFVIFLAFLVYYFAYEGEHVVDEVLETTPVHYATGDDLQKIITLHDGSTVRLNSNSEVWIMVDQTSNTREVTLSGEAYFEVKDDRQSPFIIHANESTVEVLGTMFNVRSHAHDDNIQVTVIEGSVLFTGEKKDCKNASVVLNEGQYAYLDFKNNTLMVEDYGVENYLSWMSGRLMFDALALDKVCLQLSRLYSIECSFEDETLKEMNLTSNFSNDSLEKTLSVISLSLNIDYQLDNDNVFWYAR